MLEVLLVFLLLILFTGLFFLQIISWLGPAEYKKVANRILGYKAIALILLYIIIFLFNISSPSSLNIEFVLYLFLPVIIIFVPKSVFGFLKIKISEEMIIASILLLFIISGLLFIIQQPNYLSSSSPFYLKSQTINIDLKEDSMIIKRDMEYSINNGGIYRELYISLDYHEKDTNNIHKPELVAYKCPENSYFYQQDKKDYDEYNTIEREYFEYICRNENYYDKGDYKLSFTYKINYPYLCGSDFCMVQYKIMDSFSSEVLNSKINVKNAIDYETFPKSINNEVNYIKPNNLLEFAALVPKTYSIGSFKNDNSNLKEKMEKYKRESTNYKNFEQNSFLYSILILIFTSLFIVFVYFKYGKELTGKNIDVLHYVPEKQKPWFVNLIYTGSPMSFSNDAFSATLLDLSSRDLIEIRENEIAIYENAKSDDEYEENILSFLRENSQKKEGNKFLFNPKQFESSVYSKSVSDLRSTNDVLVAFTIPSQAQRKMLDEIYDNKGAWILHVFGVIVFILGVFLYFTTSFIYNPIIEKPYILIVFAGLFITIAPFAGDYLFGRYKKDYASKRDEWDAFKNLLSNYGMIEKYKPQDINMWREWLVYATALGCADSVIKAMEKFKVSIPEIRNYNTVFFYTSLRSTVGSTLSAKTSSKTGSGFGGGGGGFGGGGGGAR